MLKIVFLVSLFLVQGILGQEDMEGTVEESAGAMMGEQGAGRDILRSFRNCSKVLLANLVDANLTKGGRICGNTAECLSECPTPWSECGRQCIPAGDEHFCQLFFNVDWVCMIPERDGCASPLVPQQCEELNNQCMQDPICAQQLECFTNCGGGKSEEDMARENTDKLISNASEAIAFLDYAACETACARAYFSPIGDDLARCQAYFHVRNCTGEAGTMLGNLTGGAQGVIDRAQNAAGGFLDNAGTSTTNGGSV